MDIASTDSDMELALDLGRVSKDPYAFVMYAFPWGEDTLADYKGPEDWQKEVLIEIRDALARGESLESAIRLATASGHGIGKSALVAWLILWAISTHEDTRGVVTANTEAQLRTKTWPELAKWYGLFIGKHKFTITATSIYSSDKEHEKTWRIDMIPWSEHRTESFAGLHNKGKRILVIYDEASAIPNVIWEVTEGALTDKDTQIIWAVFGNPTRNTGRFRECFSKHRSRWLNHRVDSRQVSITNKEQIKQWIEDYGEDSDFVKVRIRGEFPSMGDMQFISSDIVEAARGRHLRTDQYDFAAVVIGVDPGWSSDEGVIYLRQGLMSKLLKTYRNVKDDFEVAGWVARFQDEYSADAVFIDLGYGTGIFSAGKQMGRNWVLVPFGGASTDDGYANKRADMWRQMRDWLKGGGALENDPVICEQLVGVEAGVIALGPSTGKIKLESKEDMAKRGLESPDRADALCLTFTAPVMSRGQKRYRELKEKSSNKKYNPLDRNRVVDENDFDVSKISVRTWRELHTKR